MLFRTLIVYTVITILMILNFNVHCVIIIKLTREENEAFHGKSRKGISWSSQRSGSRANLCVTFSMRNYYSYRKYCH